MKLNEKPGTRACIANHSLLNATSPCAKKQQHKSEQREGVVGEGQKKKGKSETYTPIEKQSFSLKCYDTWRKATFCPKNSIHSRSGART